MPLQPVTDARIWCLQQYRISRQRGATPLQSMLEVYQDATAQTLSRSTATTEWRKETARRYFHIIAQRAKGDTLTADFWKQGSWLTTAAQK